MTKSWGMVDNRTISAVTPVDESTSDVRFMVYIGRPPDSAGKDPQRTEAKAARFGQEVIRQFEQDIDIWSHQRYSDPPALSGAEYEGFTAIRNWAKQFYPDQPTEEGALHELSSMTDRSGSSRWRPATSAPR